MGRFLRGIHPTRNVPLDGPYRVLPSEAVWRVPEEAFAGWDPGEGSTGMAGRGSGDQSGEAAWPEMEVDEVAPCLEPWPEGPPDWREDGPPFI